MLKPRIPALAPDEVPPMSDFLAEDFNAIKDSYKKDTKATAMQYLSLHELVRQDQQTNSPRLSRDAANFALYNFAIADFKAESGNGNEAGIMYAEALDAMKAAKKAGGSVAGLEDVARHVSRHLTY